MPETPSVTRSELLKAAVKEALRERGTLCISEVWQIGRDLGMFEGGERRDAKAVLDTVGVAHPGFCRAVTSAERHRAKRWADYWTPKEGRHV